MFTTARGKTVHKNLEVSWVNDRISVWKPHGHWFKFAVAGNHMVTGSNLLWLETTWSLVQICCSWKPHGHWFEFAVASKVFSYVIVIEKCIYFYIYTAAYKLPIITVKYKCNSDYWYKYDNIR